MLPKLLIALAVAGLACVVIFAVSAAKKRQRAQLRSARRDRIAEIERNWKLTRFMSAGSRKPKRLEFHGKVDD